MEILCHLAAGKSNKAIARDLGISDGTVKLHVKAILRKLGAFPRRGRGHGRRAGALRARRMSVRRAGRRSLRRLTILLASAEPRL
jgi:DNA-binding NarL/FixJ family response regulator